MCPHLAGCLAVSERGIHTSCVLPGRGSVESGPFWLVTGMTASFESANIFTGVIVGKAPLSLYSTSGDVWMFGYVCLSPHGCPSSWTHT